MPYIVSQILLLKAYINKFDYFIYIILLQSLLIGKKRKWETFDIYGKWWHKSVYEWPNSKTCMLFFNRITDQKVRSL